MNNRHSFEIEEITFSLEEGVIVYELTKLDNNRTYNYFVHLAGPGADQMTVYWQSRLIKKVETLAPIRDFISRLYEGRLQLIADFLKKAGVSFAWADDARCILDSVVEQWSDWKSFNHDKLDDLRLQIAVFEMYITTLKRRLVHLQRTAESVVL